MKASIDLPEQLYRQAKEQAAQLKTTLKEVLLSAVERGLSPGETRDVPAHFEVDDLGIPLLKRAKRDTATVTADFFNQLREQEGA